MAKCREVMTKDPASCNASESVTKVASLMKQHDVGSVPVVESDRASSVSLPTATSS